MTEVPYKHFKGTSRAARRCGPKGCQDCRDAVRAYNKALRSKREPLSPFDERHGTTNGYSGWGCRCTECKHASTIAMQIYRARKAKNSVANNLDKFAWNLS